MKRFTSRFAILFVLLFTACSGNNTPTPQPLPETPDTGAGTAGKIEVLFHPTDPSLEKIAAWIQQAKQTVDIAMYDLEVGEGSPVIATLMSEDIQNRIKAGQLSIRFIFEGYGKPAANQAKMEKLEALGADIRFVTSGKKVHHKFAVIDASLPEARVITGSANWSLTSYRNYDENILFLNQVPEATAGYLAEFEMLWNHSTEFGEAPVHPIREVVVTEPAEDEVDTYFNSPRHILKIDTVNHNLTSQILKLINEAKSELRIATTRARIIPLLEALKAAGERGVRVRILLSQDDYKDLWKRVPWLQNQPNIELRIKFYNLKPGNYMVFQMHNKFMIVDNHTVLSGSFNWSDSSENSHIENLIVLKGKHAADVLPRYTSRFDMLWERGRDGLQEFKEKLQKSRDERSLPFCGFRPISLRYEEVKELLRLAPKCQD